MIYDFHDLILNVRFDVFVLCWFCWTCQWFSEVSVGNSQPKTRRRGNVPAARPAPLGSFTGPQLTIGRYFKPLDYVVDIIGVLNTILHVINAQWVVFEICNINEAKVGDDMICIRHSGRPTRQQPSSPCTLCPDAVPIAGWVTRVTKRPQDDALLGLDAWSHIMGVLASQSAFLQLGKLVNPWRRLW